MPTLTAYEEALQTIAKVENENLLEIANIVNDLHEAVLLASKALTEKRDAMPIVAGSVTTIRSSMDSWVSQIQSTAYQIEQIGRTVSQNLDIYKNSQNAGGQTAMAMAPVAPPTPSTQTSY
jgi:hypothetical protein